MIKIIKKYFWTILILLWLSFVIISCNYNDKKLAEKEKDYNVENNIIYSLEIVEETTGKVYEGHVWMLGLYNSGQIKETSNDKYVKLVYFDSWYNKKEFVTIDYKDCAFVKNDIEYVDSESNFKYIIYLKL